MWGLFNLYDETFLKLIQSHAFKLFLFLMFQIEKALCFAHLPVERFMILLKWFCTSLYVNLDLLLHSAITSYFHINPGAQSEAGVS